MSHLPANNKGAFFLISMLILVTMLSFSFPRKKKVLVSEIPESFSNIATHRIGAITIDTEDIAISLWDNGSYTDGDIVSIYINGKLIKDNIKLKQKNKADTFKIKLDKNLNNYLLIKSKNEGALTPTTVSMTINNEAHTDRINLVVDSSNNQAFDLLMR